MTEIITLSNTGLIVSPNIFEKLGLQPGDSVVIALETDKVTIAPAPIDSGTQKLLERLRRPAGSLTERVINPDEQISLQDEIGGSIYDDADSID